MIWSLAKTLAFILAIGALAFAVGQISDGESAVRIEAVGWEFTLGPIQLIVAALSFALLVWLLIKAFGLVVAVFRFLNGDETAISRYFDRNRENKGYQALSDGMVALASGEGRLALVKAQRAEKLLNRPALTTLLIAQAAEVAGDFKGATNAYKVLLSDPATRFVGLQGLMKRKLAEGDTKTALKLAEKAFEMKPRHLPSQDILLKLQSEAADWKGARATLGAQRKTGALPKDVFRRRDAVMALQEAKVILDSDASIESRESAIEANRLSPDLIPAASMAAQSYILKGDKKNATRVLKKSWEARPHPDLAAVFAEIEPDETPEARLHRFRVLTSVNPDHDETRQLLAELSVAAEDFPAARRSLGDMPSRHPTQRNLSIMAAIERGEGSDDSVVRAWLTKAISASRGPQWCCDKCQTIHADWHPICENCAGFDTLTWREPPNNGSTTSPGFENLPLWVESKAVPKTAIPVAANHDIEALVRGAE